MPLKLNILLEDSDVLHCCFLFAVVLAAAKDAAGGFMYVLSAFDLVLIHTGSLKNRGNSAA